MQQCQDQLEFNIETPDDIELSRRFEGLKEPVKTGRFSARPRNRKSKHQKKMERINRDKSTTI